MKSSGCWACIGEMEVAKAAPRSSAVNVATTATRIIVLLFVLASPSFGLCVDLVPIVPPAVDAMNQSVISNF